MNSHDLRMRQQLGIAGRSELRGPEKAKPRKKVKKKSVQHPSKSAAAQFKNGPGPRARNKQAGDELDRLTQQIATAERKKRAVRQARLNAAEWVESPEEMRLTAQIKRLNARKRQLRCRPPTTSGPSGQGKGSAGRSGKTKYTKVRAGLTRDTRANGTRKRAKFIT